MPMKSKDNLRKKFMLQHDQSDCGVACLRNILNYYGAEISLEKLREWSGTTSEGTSMLGLCEAGKSSGFNAQGAKADGVDNLKDVQHPCILHVVKDENVLHYVVYYPGSENDKFNIGDPAIGLCKLSCDDLEKIWKSKTALLLEPTHTLQKWQQQKEKKRKWFWNSLKEDVHLLYIAIVLGLVAAALNLSTAIFSQKLIDDILPSTDRERLFVGLGLLALLLVMKSLFSYVRQFLLLRQSFQFNTRITGNFYRSILYLTKSFFDNRRTGDLIARLNDTIRIQQAISYVFGEMAIQLMLFLVSLIFIFIYSWPIGLFCLLIFPLVTMIVKYFQNTIILQQHKVMAAHAQNESNYVDSIRGISTIKVMNRENMFINIAKNIFELYQGSIFQLGKIKNKFTLTLEIVVAALL
jgi:ATP-binding cassette subfamily B protein